MWYTCMVYMSELAIPFYIIKTAIYTILEYKLKSVLAKNNIKNLVFFYNTYSASQVSLIELDISISKRTNE